MSLILTRKLNQTLVIETSDGRIEIAVYGVERDRVKLGIKAPTSVKVLREELELKDGLG